VVKISPRSPVEVPKKGFFNGGVFKGAWPYLNPKIKMVFRVIEISKDIYSFKGGT